MKSPMKDLAVRLSVSLLSLGVQPLMAATPESGSLSLDAPEVRFTAGPFPTSVFATEVDHFDVTVSLPPDFEADDPGAVLRFSAASEFNGDLLYTYTLTDLDTGEQLSTANSHTDLGRVAFVVPAGSGLRNLRLGIGTFTPGLKPLHGVVSLIATGTPGIRPNPEGPGVPRYEVYAPPEGLSGNTGEPSVGYNIFSKQAFILSGLNTLWLKFPQDLVPALPLACEGEWENRSSPITSVTTLDPIGITDSLVRGHETRRTLIGQLVGPNSAAAYSDDDGATWIPVEGGPPVAAVDHQTYGAGPYPASFPIGGLVPNPIYPNAVYYCGQDVGFASCARSDNGGISFGPATLAYTLADCAGIHGHVRVAPDGTVYIPGKACGSQVALTVSEDAGTTWEVRRVPGSQPAVRDPSVALAADNTAYFCYTNGDGRATVSITRDRARTWEAPVELGAEMGIKHSMFVNAIAGDADRATCAYLGTTTPGNPVALDFPGIWHLYFSTTYDGGKTWTTVNATPDDPVQGLGGIWNVGGGSINRNLLDFNEITLDERGYPMYGYADGCIGECDLDPTLNTFAAFPKIARQVAGKPLYAEFDPQEPVTPAPACLAGKRTPERTTLSWRVPENGGSPISGYRVYRGLAPGLETFIGTTDGTPVYVDLTADPTVPNYFYKVTAINALGEGLGSNEVELPVEAVEGESSCGLPGLRLITDTGGDSNVPGSDLVSLHLAEPQEVADTLIFQLKASSLAQLTPGTMWTVRFFAPGQNPATGVGRFIGMVAEPDGSASFVYGTAASSALVIASYTEYTVEGALDPASSYSPDGSIQLLVPRSLFNLSPGQKLFGFSMNTHTGASSSGSHLQRSNTTQDSATGSVNYTVRSADACLPNSAPFAHLVATPEKGEGPMDVTLDASASSDGEDAIVEYVFDFGDQTPQLRTAEPRVTHRYLTKGFFRATLQVKDARGKVSGNVAQAVIDTNFKATPPAEPEAPDDARFGGGAFPVPVLLLLMLAALRRRRG